MLLKKCTKPFCGKVYRETDEEFEDGFCYCGFELEAYDPTNEQPEEVEPEITPEPEADQPEPDFVPEPELKETPDENQQQPELEHDGDGWEQNDSSPSYAEEVEEDANVEAIAEELSTEQPVDSSLEEEAVPTIIDGPAYIIQEDGTLVFPEDPSYQAIVTELKEKEAQQSIDPFQDYQGDRLVAFYEGDTYRTYPLEYDEMIIGRESKGQKADIDLTDIDPDRMISRRHALIYRYNNRFYIRNLSNKNSLYVDREPIGQNDEVILEDGHSIILSGQFGMIFYQASERDF